MIFFLIINEKLGTTSARLYITKNICEMSVIYSLVLAFRKVYLSFSIKKLIQCERKLMNNQHRMKIKFRGKQRKQWYY